MRKESGNGVGNASGLLAALADANTRYSGSDTAVRLGVIVVVMLDIYCDDLRSLCITRHSPLCSLYFLSWSVASSLGSHSNNSNNYSVPVATLRLLYSFF